MFAFRMHVGFADRKWVHVSVLEITEAVVHEAVCAFV